MPTKRLQERPNSSENEPERAFEGMPGLEKLMGWIDANGIAKVLPCLTQMFIFVDYTG